MVTKEVKDELIKEYEEKDYKNKVLKEDKEFQKWLGKVIKEYGKNL